MLNEARYCPKHPDIEMQRQQQWKGEKKGWKCLACASVSVRRDKDKWKRAAFQALGNKCSVCGLSDCRILQIDHVNGDGHEERRKYGMSTVSSLSNSTPFREYFFSHLERYQLLCANCHMIKSVESGQLGASKKYSDPAFFCTAWGE